MRKSALLVLLASLPLACPPASGADAAPQETGPYGCLKVGPEAALPSRPLLFIGSSSIERWTTLDKDFPGMPIVKCGYGGKHITDIAPIAQAIGTYYRPRQIIFYAGDNDIADWHNPREVLNAYQKFVKNVRQAVPDASIHFISIKPSPARWASCGVQITAANRLIQDYTDQHPDYLRYIDVFAKMLLPDGRPNPDLFNTEDYLHLNAKGYALWTKLTTTDIRAAAP